MTTASKLALLEQAQLPSIAPWRSSKRVRMPNLKLVLMLLAVAEGEPMPRSRVIHRSGLSESQVDHSLAALAKLGLIKRLPAPGDGSTAHPRYRINTARLRDFVQPEPDLPRSHRMAAQDTDRIRDLLARGEPTKAVAARFGVSPETIRRIRRRASPTPCRRPAA